jgi:hypothetical protein
MLENVTFPPDFTASLSLYLSYSIHSQYSSRQGRKLKLIQLIDRYRLEMDDRDEINNFSINPCGHFIHFL